MTDASSVSQQHNREELQRIDRAELGIWVFLATELLFFGGLFVTYCVYRHTFPEAFSIAARETKIGIGTANTAILLTSSLMAALAVKSVKSDMPAFAARFFEATIALGLMFMILKGYEYYLDIREGYVPGPGFPLQPPETQIFWSLYWLMTGIHAVHVTVGLCVLGYLRTHVERFSSGDAVVVEVSVLYWHLVDIIWIFLFPLLYLAGRAT